jgi:hypothetical protein
MEQLFVWDVATGALFREISLQGRGGLSLPNLASISGDEMHGSLVLNIRSPDERSLICLSEELVLAADHLLVDVESEAKLWAYVGHEVVGSLGRVCWFAVLAPDESGALLPAILPQPSAKAKIQKALDAPDFFVLKPGATVKLNVSGLPDPAEREKIAAALTQKLQANGCQIGPNGTVELVAATELGKHRDLGYRSIGPPNGKAYSFQEYISRVKIVWQGQTAWEATTTNAPGFFVRLKEGQTMQQYLQEKEHPNYAWLATVDLPRVLQKPTAGGATLGTTQVTAAGLQ